jgi:mannitol/fructose-specific phosphotransferase system IIA component (Ntr-type)
MTFASTQSSSRTPAALTLADYTDARLMTPLLRGRDAQSVIEELCSVLEREGRLNGCLPFRDAVLRRELLCSTATTPGFALPHARVEGIPRLSFAVGRSTDPILWCGPRGEPVRLIFLFAVPESAPGSYLTLISALARSTRDPLLLNGLLTASGSEAMFTILQSVQVTRSHNALNSN